MVGGGASRGCLPPHRAGLRRRLARPRLRPGAPALQSARGLPRGAPPGREPDLLLPLRHRDGGHPRHRPGAARAHRGPARALGARGGGRLRDGADPRVRGALPSGARRGGLAPPGAGGTPALARDAPPRGRARHRACGLVRRARGGDRLVDLQRQQPRGEAGPRRPGALAALRGLLASRAPLPARTRPVGRHAVHRGGARRGRPRPQVAWPGAHGLHPRGHDGRAGPPDRHGHGPDGDLPAPLPAPGSPHLLRPGRLGRGADGPVAAADGGDRDRAPRPGPRGGLHDGLGVEPLLPRLHRGDSQVGRMARSGAPL